MNEELEKFLKENYKTCTAGYETIINGVNISVSEIHNGIAIIYYYVGGRTAIAPTSVFMTADISVEKFCKKIDNIVEKITK